MYDRNILKTLTEKYCEGEATPAQMNELDALIREDSSAREEFHRFCLDWQNNHKLDSIEEHALTSLISRIEDSRCSKGSVRTKLVFAYSLAAAAVVICMLTVFAELPWNNREEERYSVCASDNNSAVVNLPDASSIRLMDGARLGYTSEFSPRNRNVDFTGDAYFDISTDPEHPFSVNMGENRLKVYGTKFNVTSRNEILTVTLVKGSVELETPTRGIRIAPGEMVRYNQATGEVSVRYVNPESYLALMEGNLGYCNVTLAELVSYLGNVYGKDISLSSELASNPTRYTLRLVNNEEFDDVIDALRVMIPMSVRTEGDRVWLTEK